METNKLRPHFRQVTKILQNFVFGKRSLKGMCQEIVRLVLTVTDIYPEASIYCVLFALFASFVLMFMFNKDPE